MFKDRIIHKKIIEDFLIYLNTASSDFVLKGGTALMMCYGLNRFSEDIDLDSTNKNIGNYINGFCKKYNYNYVASKNTDTVKRYKIHYNNDDQYLKIEISYRKRNIPNEQINRINNIVVYNINELAIMKASAYSGRDKIRDFFDVCFICNNYWDEIREDVKTIIGNAIENKGMEQYDYIIANQNDELIDKDVLLNDFLKTCDRLNLLLSDKERTEQNDEQVFKLDIDIMDEE